MDRTKVSGTLDVGSIPAGAIDRKISQVSLGRLRDFYVMQDFEFGIRGGRAPALLLILRASIDFHLPQAKWEFDELEQLVVAAV